MKNFTFYFLFSVLFFANCDLSAQKEKYNKRKTSTVVFYNVENLFDTIRCSKYDAEFTPEGRKKWNTARYKKKLKNLSWVISRINIRELPEIIGFSEIENKKVLEDLAKQKSLLSGKYKIVHEDSPDLRGIDVALMYRPDEFKYISHRSIPIKFTKEQKYKVRDILYVKGKISRKETLHIFVNHWKSRRGGIKKTEQKRIISAEILRNHVDSIFAINPKAKIIIMGDMNDEPENKSLFTTLQATNNLINPKKKELFNLMYNKSISEKGTYSYSGDWLMLDNLIISHSLISGKGYNVNPAKGEIFMSKKILYNNPKAGTYVPSKTYGGKNYYGGYSDHLPVYFFMEK